MEPADEDVMERALQLLQAETSMTAAKAMGFSVDWAAEAAKAEKAALHAEVTIRAKDTDLLELESMRAKAEKDAAILADKAANAEMALATALRDAEAERAGRLEATRLLTERLRGSSDTSKAAVIDTVDASSMADAAAAAIMADASVDTADIPVATPAEAMEAARAKAREGHNANGASDFAIARACFERAYELSEPAGIDAGKERATYLVSAANMALKLDEVADAKAMYEQVLTLPRVDASIRKRVVEKLADPRFAPAPARVAVAECALTERSCAAAKICMGESCACQGMGYGSTAAAVAAAPMEASVANSLELGNAAELLRLVRKIDSEARCLADAVEARAMPPAPAADSDRAEGSAPPLKKYSKSGFAEDVYREPSFLGGTGSGRASPKSVTDEASFNAASVQETLQGVLALLAQSHQRLTQVNEGAAALAAPLCAVKTYVSAQL